MVHVATTMSCGYHPFGNGENIPPPYRMLGGDDRGPGFMDFLGPGPT